MLRNSAVLRLFGSLLVASAVLFGPFALKCPAQTGLAVQSPPFLPGQTDKRSQWIYATLDERQRLAEQIGEEGARAYCKARGWEEILGPGGYRQGYDQVWRDPKRDLLFTVEAKGGNSPVPPHQKEIEWVIKKAEDIAFSQYSSPWEKRTAVKVLEYASKGRLRHLVIRTTHSHGTPGVPKVEHVATVTGSEQQKAWAAVVRARPVLRKYFSYFSGAEEAAEGSVGATRAARRAGRVLGTFADEAAEAAAGAYGVSRSTAYGGTAARHADEAAEAATQVSRVIGRVGRVVESACGPVSVGIEVVVGSYEAYQREKAYRQGRISNDERWRGHVGQATGTAGGIGGAIYGAAAGAAVGGPVGAVIGAGIGAIGGSEAGRYIGRKAYDLWRFLTW